MKNLVFNTQICTTKEQSKRLLELGLDADTSDMLIIPLPNGKELIVQKFADESGNLYYKIKGEQWESSPAWSLHRLIAMLPDRDRFCLTDCCDFKDCSKIYNEVISLIEWMIENGHFNKEYLKEE
jgi:hypothetical protein